MEIAKLVLEFLKVLIWPLIALYAVVRFRDALGEILVKFSTRLQTANTLKLGVMGSQIEISGTAQELSLQRDKLLKDKPELSVEQVQDSISRLQNPVTDQVGIALMRSPADRGRPIEEIVREVYAFIAPSTEPQPNVLVVLANEIEKLLVQLEGLNLVVQTGDGYALTDSGRALFTKVAARQQELLGKFSALRR